MAAAAAQAVAIRVACSATVGLVGLRGFSTSLGGFIQGRLLDPTPEDRTTTRRMIIVRAASSFAWSSCVTSGIPSLTSESQRDNQREAILNEDWNVWRWNL